MFLICFLSVHGIRLSFSQGLPAPVSGGSGGNLRQGTEKSNGKTKQKNTRKEKQENMQNPGQYKKPMLSLFVGLCKFAPGMG